MYLCTLRPFSSCPFLLDFIIVHVAGLSWQGCGSYTAVSSGQLSLLSSLVPRRATCITSALLLTFSAAFSFNTHSLAVFHPPPKLRWLSSCILFPGQGEPPAADLWCCLAISTAPQALSSSCPSSICPGQVMHRHYPSTGDQVLAAVNPHPMSPNLRNCRWKVFCWFGGLPLGGRDFSFFFPLQAPHYGASGCSRKAFPNGSCSCLPARSGVGRCCGVGVGTGMRLPVLHGWTQSCDLEPFTTARSTCRDFIPQPLSWITNDRKSWRHNDPWGRRNYLPNRR